MSGPCFHAVMSPENARPRDIDRKVQDRLRRVERAIGEDLERLRIEAAVTKSSVARASGIDRSFYGRIERGEAHPSLETIEAAALALGGDMSVRIYRGSGPRLVDRHSARMTEAVLSSLAPVWRPHLEVPVWRPVRGVIDAVLDRADGAMFVLTEFISTLTRLEQQVRWSAEKADAIGSSRLVGERPTPPTSKLLVLRSTAANRDIARRFESMLRAAYPASAAAAVAAVTSGSPWPGDAIIWVRIEGTIVTMLPGPPRGLALGR
jgi:transcriptional regulator with XRE-family HTH domain